jgi:hypothetical protein
MVPSIFPESPLGRVINDIYRAIEAQLYYPALLVTLTLPEICSALALSREVFVKEKHYINFLEEYADLEKLGMDSVDCYRLRGGVVHRANFAGHAKFDASHVLFTLPISKNSIHGISLEVEGLVAANFDLVMFCKEMIAAANKWHEKNKDSDQVKSNLQNLIRFCPKGVAPFSVGNPVVASGPEVNSDFAMFDFGR